MRLIKGIFIIAFFFVLPSVFSPNANPNPPTAYLVLSEVQITDSAHWTVEVLYNNMFQNIRDTFTTKYTLVYKNVNPVFRPKIKVNSNGYALITPQDYSTPIRFHPGDTVKLHYDYLSAMNYNDTVPPRDTMGDIWKCIIDKNLKPTQSMVAFQEEAFTPFLMWCKSDSPTIGSANNAVGIYGIIKGFVCDKDSQALKNFSVSYNCNVPGMIRTCTAITDSSGHFVAPNLVSSDQKTFSFPGMSAKTFGPFSVEPECTLNVICKLDDYVPTAERNPVFCLSESSIKIIGITKDNSGVLIVFSGSKSVGDYNVAVFSLSGKKIFSSVVSNTGSGTYSVAWKDVTHSGYYITRISSKNGSVERKFLLR
jgi:hypothetical protein